MSTFSGSKLAEPKLDAEDRIENILREQAQVYARPPDDGQTVNETAVLLFQLGGERYAVDLGLLQSVHPANGITEVPCLPPTIAGIVNVRGDVVTILDLGVTFGTGTSASRREDARILLVDAPSGGRVGLLVDAVIGVRQVKLSELDRSWFRQDSSDGIIEASIILVNLKQLLSSEHFELSDAIFERLDERMLVRSTG